MQVWLIECNSSPAVAEELNQKLAEDLVAKEIDPYFGVCVCVCARARGCQKLALPTRFAVILGCVRSGKCPRMRLVTRTHVLTGVDQGVSESSSNGWKEIFRP